MKNAVIVQMGEQPDALIVGRDEIAAAQLKEYLFGGLSEIEEGQEITLRLTKRRMSAEEIEAFQG